MTIRGGELLNAAELLAKEKNIQVAVKGSLAGGAMAGASSFAGGLFLGPVGLAIGGLAGGLVGYAVAKDRFKPLHEVIANDLTAAQRNQLINHLRLALKDFDINDVFTLTALIMSNTSVEGALLNSLVAFAQSEMKMSIKS